MASNSEDTWLDAAYSRFESEGLSAVRVEAIARDIGATKGSFYWHFGNRQALIDAVMARWEREQTDEIIALADLGGSPEERMTRLYSIVATRVEHRSGEATLYVEAESEGVADAVARVSRRRIGYIADILTELGFARDEAVNRSTIALAAVLGLQQLVAATGDAVLGENGRAITESALRMTLAR
ncbi:MAG: helix-turn-helix domain-containing protein [Microbacterium sp.]